METVLELKGSGVPTVRACHVLGVSRATFYRHHGPAGDEPEPEPEPGGPKGRRTSHRALSAEERAEVLETLHSARFVDAAPAQVYATLLEEGVYLCSIRTMYRILAAAGEVRERRNQRRHPVYEAPCLQATAPNQVWTWDITKLKGPTKWRHLHLYVILDIYSRYVVGWMVADRECSNLAKSLIETSCQRHGILPNELTLHADRGPSMTSKTVAELLTDLGIDKSHSRPRVSNDNAFSEAQFKTLKSHREFPGSFDSIENAQTFLRPFFDSYNHEHKHSGIALMSPATVHNGEIAEVVAKRQQALDRAYARTPHRFSQPPRALGPPDVVYLGEALRAEVILLRAASTTDHYEEAS